MLTSLIVEPITISNSFTYFERINGCEELRQQSTIGRRSLGVVPETTQRERTAVPMRY